MTSTAPSTKRLESSTPSETAIRWPTTELLLRGTQGRRKRFWLTIGSRFLGLALQMGADERPDLRQRAPSRVDLLVEQRPGVDHVGPDFEPHRHVDRPRRAREAHGVIQQDFRGANQDQQGRKSAQVRVKGRRPWIPWIGPVEVGPSQLVQIG